jgi:hypothetical protein
MRAREGIEQLLSSTNGRLDLLEKHMKKAPEPAPVHLLPYFVPEVNWRLIELYRSLNKQQ